MMDIKEFANKQNGTTVAGVYIMAAASIRKTAAGKPYLDATLSDATGTVNAKMWNYNGGVPVIGEVYEIVATLGEYAGKKQLTLNSLDKSSEQNKLHFVPKCLEYPEAVYDRLHGAAKSLSNETLREVTLAALEDYKQSWLVASAARTMHHVGIGGNLQHTDEVLDLATLSAAALQSNGYDVNMDLVRAGAICHDFGKLFTYGYNGAAVDMTYEGQLLDHIMLGACKLSRIFSALYAQNPNLDPWALNLLLHIVGSHHGAYDKGSPVVPLCYEAYIVNAADELSAKMDELRRAMEAAPRNAQWTGRIFPLNNRPHLMSDVVQEVMEHGYEKE